ncbi:uncharacterized protein [Watersipora subatra]|uniref:uncharacterized protein n=1 Tax=Watersipora subatra TaxID=2589382 RepID=UPI00355C5A33
MDYGSAHIKPFGVAVDPLTVGSRWRKWKRSFEYFVAARGIADNAQKKAMLMDLSGEEVQDIFDVLPEETEGDNVYVKAMAALDRYFEPKTNVPYERSVFPAVVDSLDFTNNAQEADVDALFTISSEMLADEGDNYYGEVFNLYPNKSARTILRLNGSDVPALIDSGASCNLMDKYTADSINFSITKTSKRLFAYGNRSACLDLIGETHVHVFMPDTNRRVDTVFYVFNGRATALLSRHTSELLDLLRVGPMVARVHFAMYLIGLQFRLVTDHRPLQFIFNKVQSRPSARIERWVLRLMAFDYEVVYKPGKENIADPLSRLSASPDCIRNVANVADEYVHTVARLSVPKAMSFDEVKKASIDCSEMKLVRDALLDGRWSTCLPAYRSVYTELSDVEGVVMRGNNIVMPVVLRAKAVELAHEGHQGRECHECQVVSAPSKPPPMVSTKMPDRPWEHIACDILGPLPNGESVFVVVDYYSRYFEEKSRALTDEGRSQDDIIVGDKVLVRQAKTDKLSSTFHQLEQKVVGKHGSEVVVESSEGKRMRRNVSEVKRFVQRGNIPDKSSNPAAPEQGQSAKFDTPIRPLRVRNMPVRLSISSLSLGFDLACGCAVGLALLGAFSSMPVVAIGCILACVTLRSICIFNTGAMNSIKDGKGCSELTCPAPYTYNPISETCFRLIETALNWDNADAYCRANGEYLATFTTTEASEWLRAKIESDLDSSNSGWGRYNFIGGQKGLTEFEWKGLVTGVIPGNGQPNSDWYYNQPDNIGSDICLGIAPEGWRDLYCSTPRPFVCEYN